jgi:RNA processing factor Prp31
LLERNLRGGDVEKLRTKKEVRKDVKEQAEEIMYFEASMSNIDKATKALAERLESLYYAGYNDGMDYAVNNPDKLGASY